MSDDLENAGWRWQAGTISCQISNVWTVGRELRNHTVDSTIYNTSAGILHHLLWTSILTEICLLMLLSARLVLQKCVGYRTSDCNVNVSDTCTQGRVGTYIEFLS